jgi:peptide/nickel transport system permease protein
MDIREKKGHNVNRFGFVGQRLLQMIPVVIGITIIAFFLIHLIPGDPVSAILGNHYTPQLAKQLRASLGLDKSIWQQYLIFMGHLLQGNLGDSIYYQQSVISLIGDRLEPTIWLVLYAAALALVIAVPLAILAALYRDTIIDQVIRAVFIVTLAMPAFWVGIIFVLILSVHWRIFPVTGFGTGGVTDHLWHLFLPALTIALSFSAVLIRSLRNSILTVMTADYVDTARAKGISGRRIMLRHIVRNALLSTVTIFGINIAFLMGSTVIVEDVFAVGGIGNLLTSAILQRDYAVVQGVVLLIALSVVLVNLLTDVVYALLDPRVSIS